MKLLMIYAERFAYKTSVKAVESASEITEEKIIENALVGFIHIEEKDEENISNVETKMIKNLKWAARKNNTNKILLHSFAHLSETKASPEITKQLLDNSEKRLQKANYEVYQTPFGYFLDLDLKAPGSSFARLFKEI
jgi:hypothetical protein